MLDGVDPLKVVVATRTEFEGFVMSMTHIASESLHPMYAYRPETNTVFDREYTGDDMTVMDVGFEMSTMAKTPGLPPVDTT